MFMEVYSLKHQQEYIKWNLLNYALRLQIQIQTTDTIGFHITYTAMRIYHILS